MADLDSIVVGAGTAGCVVARRLFDAGQTVCLIEAGPGEPRPSAVRGADVVAAAQALDRQWPGLLAAPSQTTAPSRYRQGFGIGGSSSINALILSPGDHADYQRWAVDQGCPEWGPEAMGQWIERVTAEWPSGTTNPGPVTEAFVTAAKQAGHPVGGDSLEPGRLGVLKTRLSVVGDRRRSSFDHYIAPALEGAGRERIQLSTGQAVTRIMTTTDRPDADRTAADQTDADQTVGVVLDDGTELTARRVVVCAGAVATPRLLRASGLGRPAVGTTLRDHPSFAFTLGLRSAVAGSDERGSGPPAPDAGRRLVSRLLRWSSRPNSGGRADLQAFVIDRVDDGEADTQRLAVVAVGLMDVSSVGWVNHAAPAGSPVVITGALDTEDDRARMRAGVRHVHQLLRSEPMQAIADQVFLDDQGTPATALDTMSDADLNRLILATPGPYSHPAGTCPMGPEDDPAAVVSSLPEDGGLLHGHPGVHVIDASVMPHLVRGGLQLPVTVIAERLAAGLVGSEPVRRGTSA